MSDEISRLKSIASDTFGSLKKMANELGEKGGYLHVYTSRGKLSPKLLIRLEEELGINKEYLKHGTLPIFLKELKNTGSKGSDKLPLYDIDARGGDVHLFNDNNEEPVDFIKMPNLRGKVAVVVHGDSMSPVYSDGDIVTISEPITNIMYGKAYLIITNNQRMIKYIIRAIDDDTVICKSENKLGNPDFELNKSDILKLFLIETCIKVVKY